MTLVSYVETVQPMTDDSNEWIDLPHGWIKDYDTVGESNTHRIVYCQENKPHKTVTVIDRAGVATITAGRKDTEILCEVTAESAQRQQKVVQAMITLYPQLEDMADDMNDLREQLV
jgi:hypothetical protein